MRKKTIRSPKTRDDYRRRFQWSARHYSGKAKNKPFVKNGQLTNHSLQAKRWGFKPPRNQTQANRIVSKTKKDWSRVK